MKSVQTLKKLIDIFYFLLLFTTVVYIIIIVWYLLADQSTISEYVKVNSSLVHNDSALHLFEFSFLLVFLIFVKGVYHSRKSIPAFIKGDYFQELVTDQFTIAGNHFTLAGVFGLVLHMVSQWYLNEAIWIGIDYQMYVFLFLIIIGLFFKFFSAVFTEARKVQHENDLTI